MPLISLTKESRHLYTVTAAQLWVVKIMSDISTWFQSNWNNLFFYKPWILHSWEV